MKLTVELEQEEDGRYIAYGISDAGSDWQTYKLRDIQTAQATDDVLKWLQDSKSFPNLSPEELAALERLSSDELMRRFLETLAEQNERHDGGDRWVGTGGRSPYGHGGQHPTGIRVGPRACRGCGRGEKSASDAGPG